MKNRENDEILASIQKSKCGKRRKTKNKFWDFGAKSSHKSKIFTCWDFRIFPKRPETIPNNKNN